MVMTMQTWIVGIAIQKAVEVSNLFVFAIDGHDAPRQATHQNHIAESSSFGRGACKFTELFNLESNLPFGFVDALFVIFHLVIGIFKSLKSV